MPTKNVTEEYASRRLFTGISMRRRIQNSIFSPPICHQFLKPVNLSALQVDRLRFIM